MHTHTHTHTCHACPKKDLHTHTRTLSSQDRPTGECFVQLKSTASAAKAARLDKQYLGSRYIEVFQVRELMEVGCL